MKKRERLLEKINNSELLSFLLYLEKDLGYSENTFISYGYDINEFLLYLQKENVACEDVKRDVVRFYILSLKQKGNDNASIARKISSLRRFYSYLVRYKGYESNPFEVVSTPKKSKKLPEFFSSLEITMLLEDNKKRTDKLAIRDQAILELLFASGLRVAELISLKFSDIDFEKKEIRVIGKGNKERITYFNDESRKAILEYKSTLRFILLGDKEDDGTVFLNRNGEKFTERGIEYLVKRAAEKSNFPLRVHPHMFRHSFATELMNNDADMRVIQELLGHSSLSTTAIYTDVSFNDLKKTYDECFPSVIKEEKK